MSSRIYISREITIWSPLVMPQRREARLTVSPTTVYSIRSQDPMFPASMLPVLIPILSLTGASPCASRCRFSWVTSFWISRAQLTAWKAWSASVSGAPNTSMAPSPMYLSTMPWLIEQAQVMRVKYRFSISTSAFGSICSEIFVKPVMSANRTLPSICLPLSPTSSRFDRICLATPGET